VWAVQRFLGRRPEGAKDTLLVKEEDGGRYSGDSVRHLIRMLLKEAGVKGAEKYRVHNCRMVGTSIGLEQLPEAAVRRTMRLSQTSTALDKAYNRVRARLCDELGKEADRVAERAAEREKAKRVEAAGKAVGERKKVRAAVDERGVGDGVLKGARARLRRQQQQRRKRGKSS
jgi:hypothetical protein